MKYQAWVGFIALVVTCTPVAGLCAGNTLIDAANLMDQGQTAEALQLFEKLAAEGDDRAMVLLGVYYYQGDKVQQDYDKAMDWFLRAFARQNAAAFVYLGAMHYEGHGVPQNKKIAYCVFLTTHMGGLGSQTTQLRSNRYLRRILNELSQEDVKDCLSHYTRGCIRAYLDQKETLVFSLDHPVNPVSCDWNEWQQPAYALKNKMESFALLHGKEPRSKTTDLPANSPELRFRVEK